MFNTYGGYRSQACLLYKGEKTPKLYSQDMAGIPVWFTGKYC